MRVFTFFLGGILALSLCGCDLISGGSPKKTSPPVTAVNEPPPPPPYEEISLKSHGRRVPVIMYHDIIATRGQGSQWFDCTADEFEQQMQWLQDQGAVPISVADLYGHLTAGKEIPETAVVLTFDDNYQGFYDHAWPILKRFNFPAMMFVHTGYVGQKTGMHPKMSWDTLKELSENPLFSVGSHTITHPDDMAALDPITQQKELEESKKSLEEHLGKPIDFLAYPNGKGDETTYALAKAAGYKMAFTIHNGLAEDSPGIMAIDRYVHTRTQTAWQDRANAIDGGATAIYAAPIAKLPIQYRNEEHEGVRLSLVTGGEPETVTSETREGVRDFVRRTGAQAGINGTFFAMAAIKSTDNQLVGPAKTPEMPAVVGDEEKSRWDRLRNRPVVMWGPTELRIVSFAPETMRDDAAFRDLMPDVQNVFMGGALLVHNGIALTREQQNRYGSKDMQDPRRRAAFGVDSTGGIVFAVARESVSSAKFAEALVSAGLTEAVLLDSGFSTSLVVGDYLLASGHSSPTEPSRPVPHAIMLRGEVDEASMTQAKADALPEPGAEAPRRRRK